MVVTKIDPKYLTTYDNHREFDNIRLKQGDKECYHRKQSVNTRLFIDQLVNCASFKKVINVKKPPKKYNFLLIYYKERLTERHAVPLSASVIGSREKRAARLIR